MDKIDVQQAGGFPLETDTLDFMQRAYMLLNSLTGMAGELSIVSGCHQIGNTVGDGVVVINGELLPFQGGNAGSHVIVSESTENRVFESGESKVVFRRRVAKFGGGSGAKLWANFKRITPLNAMGDFHERIQKLEKYAKPFTGGGAYVLWNRPANEIPEGWEEATELRGRIPVGFLDSIADFDTLGKEGGNRKITLTTGQLPEHSFEVLLSESGEHKHGYADSFYIENSSIGEQRPPGTQQENLGGGFMGSGDTDDNNNAIFYRNRETAESGGHTHDVDVSTIGNGEDIDIMNPYRVVMFIKPIID